MANSRDCSLTAVRSTFHSQRYLLALIALFIIPISGISIDLYVPSLPAICHYFLIDQALAQYSVTVYLLGMAVMQVFAGSISDSFGRKKPFLSAMLIYIVATLGIAECSHIENLLGWRLLQGLAVGAMMVPMRSVIPDLFTGPELSKMVGYMTVAWSIGPIIAPAIGGQLQSHYGWQANFYALLIYSSLSFLLTLFFLPETSQHRHPFQIKPILQRSRTILLHRGFVAGLLSNGLLYSILLLFAVVGPFLIQDVLHYSPEQFGRMALLMGLAWFLGAMSTRFMLGISVQTKAKRVLWGMLCIALLSVAIAWLLPLSVYSILIPVISLSYLGGVLFPCYFVHSLSLFPHISGSANALFGAAVFFISGLLSAGGSVLKSTTQLPLALAYLSLVSLCLLIFYRLFNKDPS